MQSSARSSTTLATSVFEHATPRASAARRTPSMSRVPSSALAMSRPPSSSRIAHTANVHQPILGNMSGAGSLSVLLLSLGLSTLSVASTRSLIERMSPRMRARRRAERAHLTPIAQITTGTIVKVVGRVSFAEPPLEAPFSGRPCAYFEAAVASKQERGYQPRASVCDGRSFWLRDDSGRVFVDAHDSVVEVLHDHLWTPSDGDPEERFALERALYQNGPRWQRLLSMKDRLRYSEGALVEDEIVTVVGLAAVTHDPTLAHYRDVPRRLSLVAPQRGRLFVSDAMHLDA